VDVDHPADTAAEDDQREERRGDAQD